MSIQMMLIGSEGLGTITAEAMTASKISLSTISLSLIFNRNGTQATEKDGNISVEGNWISPPSKASEWEIRATLDSGVTPVGSALGVWLPLTSDQAWSLTIVDAGLVESFLTFEFRKVGGSSAEFTVTGNSMSGEVVSIM